jgi:molybdopterin-binding protein
MKYGARNQITAVVKNIKRDKVISQVDLEVPAKSKMGSVMTTDSLDELGLKKGDKVRLIVKAISVLVVKED